MLDCASEARRRVRNEMDDASMSTKPRQFYPMPRLELFTLLALVAFSCFAFLPVWRSVLWHGLAVFGWLMALLMVVSPAMALGVFLWSRRS